MGYENMGEKDTEYMAPPPINFDYRIKNTSSSDDDNDEDDSGFGLMLPITEEYNGDVSDLFSYDIDRNVSEYDTSDLFSYDIDRNLNEVVCVVMWKLGSVKLCSASMDALVWTLENDLHEPTIVYLVHVFPQLRFIPTLLGRLPISEANPVQKEEYRIQERSKRSEYLQRFVSRCSSSKVQFKTLLIEGDSEANAIVDFVRIQNIRKLVLGATKLSLRKLVSIGKKGGGGTLGQILHNAPEFCEVKVICEGKEVFLQDELTTAAQYPSLRHINAKTLKVKPMKEQQDRTNSFLLCNCFIL